MISFFHSSSGTGTKSRPARLVLIDEFDACSFKLVQKMRGRTTRAPGAKIVMLSALDSDAEHVRIDGRTYSPALLEFESSSQAYYFLPDPAGGKPFKLEFGWPREDKTIPPWGVKWDHAGAKRENGTINEARIAETVRYVTPGGAELSDMQIKDMIFEQHLGRWIHTFPELENTKPGYLSTVLYQRTRSLASIVLEFLNAKRQGGQVYREHMLEQWAEMPWIEKIELTDRTFASLQQPYDRGSPFWLADKFLTACTTEQKQEGQKT